MAELGRNIDLSKADGHAEALTSVAFSEFDGGMRPLRAENGSCIERSDIVSAAAAQGLWLHTPGDFFVDSVGAREPVVLTEGNETLLLDDLFGQPRAFTLHPDERSAGLSVRDALAYRGQ